LVIERPKSRVITSPEELRRRTRAFSLRIIKFFRALPRTEEARVLGRQVLRSGTAVGANYRSACRARSRADFISKIGIAIEEADETAYWLELFIEAGIVKEERLHDLLAEANEIVRILQASRNTAKSRSSIANRESQTRPIANPRSQVSAAEQSPIANRQSQM
jgi:four helix bundle protein